VTLSYEYEAGSHSISLAGNNGLALPEERRVRGSFNDRARRNRWTVKVDAVPLAGEFTTRPDAWTAGVIEADRLDRFAAAGSGSSPGRSPSSSIR
jgi:hypothetical protein